MNRFAALLDRALTTGRAVGAFTCYNLEECEAVISSAEARSAPAVILVSLPSFDRPGGERLIKAFRAMASNCTQEILIQLDHASNPTLIHAAIECGIDAVMVDGSRLPLPENTAFTKAVTEAISSRGIGVEAELGRVEGNEDVAGSAPTGEMTDPEQVADFAKATGVDCLAVAIGNVHGHYTGIPELDWDLLQEISKMGEGFLSLHGASGLPADDLHKARSLGIVKINVNTEMRSAYFARLDEQLGATRATLNLQRLGLEVTAAVASTVDGKLRAFGW